MSHHVRGALFADYVRMIRSQKDVDWSSRLSASDREYLEHRVIEDDWYPMEIFERLGLAILSTLPAGAQAMQLVRLWGRAMVTQGTQPFPELLAPHDPRETVMRLRVHRNAFFDFDAHELLVANDQEARLRVGYGMSPRAEEAACWQTLGFTEELITQAGARDVRGDFDSRSWAGDPQTVIALEWHFTPSLHPPVAP